MWSKYGFSVNAFSVQYKSNPLVLLLCTVKGIVRVYYMCSSDASKRSMSLVQMWQGAEGPGRFQTLDSWVTRHACQRTLAIVSESNSSFMSFALCCRAKFALLGKDVDSHVCTTNLYRYKSLLHSPSGHQRNVKRSDASSGI